MKIIKRKTLITSFALILFIVISGFCNRQNANDTLNKYDFSSQINMQNTIYSFIITPSEDQDDAGTGNDAGNSSAFSTIITEGDYNGTLVSEDKDYYKFSVQKGTIINVTMLAYNPIINFDLTLYTPEFQPIQNLKDAGIRETIIRSSLESGNFTILIAPSTLSDVGNYSFSLSLTSQNDFNSGTDAGNGISDPLLVTNGVSNGTFVKDSDFNDFYKVSLAKGQIISIFMESDLTTNIDLILYDSDSTEVEQSKRLVGLDESIYYAISITSDYVLHVELLESMLIVIPYNLSIIITTQNDGNSGTDAGNTPADALYIIPLRNSIFKGQLIFSGDPSDFYVFEEEEPFTLFANLEVPNFINFDLKIYDSDSILLYSSDQELEGAKESILVDRLENGTYYIEIKFISGSITPLEGSYTLNIGVFTILATNNDAPDWGDIIMKIISYGMFPLIIIIIILIVLVTRYNVKIPLLSKWLDSYYNKEGKEETTKSLKYALRVRDDQIGTLREELIEKDGKRAKDLETIHRLEEDQKSKETVLGKLREENINLKTNLNNLQAVNEDLANIIDSTIRRQLAKSSKQTQTVKISSITSLLWLSEERFINYIHSVPLLSERYILDKTKSYVLTREYAREIVRQAYWKRVGAMHLKKIKQVKVSNLTEDTDIEINTLKEILRELVERKEIPAPIHMDRISLLLSISEELIVELTDLAQNSPIISLKEISKSYDTSIESAKKIFEKISEEGYTKGEFISEDIFIVYDLFANLIIDNGSIDMVKLAEERKLSGHEEDLIIVTEKLIQEGKLSGEFMTENLFLCFNNLSEQLKELIKNSITDIAKGDTRKVVFDLGSVVESIVKERLIIDIHEMDNVSLIPKYQEVIEAKELGRILRASEDSKITLPSNVELKSLNRFWAQKIKHTKPGELPYIPTIEESKEFLFESNKALNKLLAQKIPTKWKKSIAEKLLEDTK